MELLAKLLGGYERVKVLRFFLHHGGEVVSSTTLSHKIKVKPEILRKELAMLASISFIEKKRTRSIIFSNGKKGETKVKEVLGWVLREDFPHVEALKELLFDFEGIDKKELARRFKSIGRIKLFLVAGVFVGSDKSRLDILIVGESIKKEQAEKIMNGLSAELGRDIVYALMDVEEYEYRGKMYDTFLRDIFDFPHEVVIDRISKKGESESAS